MEEVLPLSTEEDLNSNHVGNGNGNSSNISKIKDKGKAVVVVEEIQEEEEKEETPLIVKKKPISLGSKSAKVTHVGSSSSSSSSGAAMVEEIKEVKEDKQSETLNAAAIGAIPLGDVIKMIFSKVFCYLKKGLYVFLCFLFPPAMALMNKKMLKNMEEEEREAAQELSKKHKMMMIKKKIIHIESSSNIKGNVVGEIEEPVKELKLCTSDNFVFVVPETIMLQSEAIKYMIEDGCAEDEIPLHNVTGYILKKVIEYCDKHACAKFSEKEELKKWDAEFIDAANQKTLYDLILAANFLSVKGLLDLCTQKVADMMKAKTPEEIRKIFNIKNDFTPEEEAEIRSENSWAFE